MKSWLFSGDGVDVEFTSDAGDHGVPVEEVLHVIASVLGDAAVGSQGDESIYWLGTDRAGLRHVEVQAKFVGAPAAPGRRLRIITRDSSRSGERGSGE